MTTQKILNKFNKKIEELIPYAIDQIIFESEHFNKINSSSVLEFILYISDRIKPQNNCIFFRHGSIQKFMKSIILLDQKMTFEYDDTCFLEIFMQIIQIELNQTNFYMLLDLKLEKVFLNLYKKKEKEEKINLLLTIFVILMNKMDKFKEVFFKSNFIKAIFDLFLEIYENEKILKQIFVFLNVFVIEGILIDVEKTFLENNLEKVDLILTKIFKLKSSKFIPYALIFLHDLLFMEENFDVNQNLSKNIILEKLLKNEYWVDSLLNFSQHQNSDIKSIAKTIMDEYIDDSTID